MKVSLNIPTSLADISLKKYLEYEKSINTLIEEEDLLITKISIFCNIDIESVKNMEIADINEINSILNYTLNAKTDLIRTFKLNGIEYGFIPNLDKMTFGEFVDLDTIITDTKNLHKTMAILYRPIVKKKGDLYDIARYTGDEDADAMLEMPMDVVNGALVFFYSLGKELLKAIPSYLQKQVEEQMTSQELLSLEKNGVGYQAYISSLKEKFTELDKSLDSMFMNA